MNYFKQLIKNNTGVSSKSFVMVIGTLVVQIAILTGCFYIIFSLLTGILIDWIGLAQFFTALAGVSFSFIWGKVKGESNNNTTDVN